MLPGSLTESAAHDIKPVLMESAEEPRSSGAPSPMRCDEATWRTRDLKKAVESLGREYLAREISLGSSISQRMAKTLKTVHTTHASLGKVCWGDLTHASAAVCSKCQCMLQAHEQLRAMTAKLTSAKQIAANKLL